MWPQVTPGLGPWQRGWVSRVAVARAAILPHHPARARQRGRGSRGRGPSLTLEVDPRADPQHTREGGEVQGANEVLQRHGLHGPRDSLDADRVAAARALSPQPHPAPPPAADVGGAAPPMWAGPLRCGAWGPRGALCPPRFPQP